MFSPQRIRTPNKKQLFMLFLQLLWLCVFHRLSNIIIFGLFCPQMTGYLMTKLAPKHDQILIQVRFNHPQTIMHPILAFSLDLLWERLVPCRSSRVMGGTKSVGDWVGIVVDVEVQRLGNVVMLSYVLDLPPNPRCNRGK